MNTILALDIGTEYVKAILARPGRRESLEILGVGKAQQKEGGMHNSAVANIPAVVETCEKAIYDAEKEAGVKANLTVVGVAGEMVKGNTTTVRYHREEPNKPISNEEIEQIIKKVQQKSGEVARKTVAFETGNETAEMRLINSAIVSMAIDGYKVSNPIGFKGTDVSIQFYTAFAPLVQVAAIEKICAELNLELLTLVAEPFAICRACLVDDAEAEFSGIVIDVGGATTDVAIVEDSGVLGTKSLAIGGRNLERNINAWLAGLEVILDDFDISELPRNIILCGGGADNTLLQETLAISDWYQGLPFARRPVINVLEISELPNLNLKKHELDCFYATAIGLLRVGMDTLESAPEENRLKHRIERLLQK